MTSQTTLSEEDVKLFYRLHPALIFHANKKLDMIKNLASPEDIAGLDMEKVFRLKEKMYKSPDIIDSFVSENPERLSQEELDIVGSWKKNKGGEFFLVKHAKEHSVFYDSKGTAYGVLGLHDTFEDMLGTHLPIMVDIVLLPFKGKIIFDGIMMPYPVHFGAGMRKSLKTEVDDAIRRNGIITSLEKRPEVKETSDEEDLRFYLKTEANRERYWEEIEKLSSKNDRLTAVFHQEIGRINSRDLKKRLKGLGAKGIFAVIEDTIVASAATEDELDKALAVALPPDKKEWIHRFKI